MNWVETVSKYYKAGYYTNEQVKIFVVKGKITATDYENIIGIAYIV
jgi:uncharacterized XkdX family phage protein